ncbi:MAG: ChbG/HpnK family deacetylase [Clostridia bacterium]|nr:ChbG/HpnK family deacetylase [Clostridia bacterium]
MMGIIINADDFGLNISCTKAIAEAFGKGLVTDTTMTANGEAFAEALNTAKENGFRDKIGIHFNITEGAPLTDDIKKCPAFSNGTNFRKDINRLKPLTATERDALYKELSAQVKKIAGSGIKITHADSHHHIHTAIFIYPIIARVCRENGIDKIRLHRNLGKIPFYKRIIKNGFNNKLRKDGFKTTEFFASFDDLDIKSIPENLEIMVHPDFGADGCLLDREGYDGDGNPKGMPLSKIQNDNFICYGDL